MPETFIGYARRDPAGPELFAAARRKIKTGKGRPIWRLHVARKDMTQNMAFAAPEFQGSGESLMRFGLKKPLQAGRWENARVHLWIGYGSKLIPFFWGKLEEPKDSRSGLFSEATAYGISRMLGERRFLGRVSWAGKSLAFFHHDFVARCGEHPGRFELRGGRGETVEADQEGFNLETTFLEAERAVLEPLGFLAHDQPGGQHVTAPKTRLSDAVSGRLSGVFSEGEYPKDGFSFSQGFRNYYSKVVVFRRSEHYAQGGAASSGGYGMVQAEDGSWVPQSFYGSDAERETSFSRPYKTTAGTAREYAVYAEMKVANRGPFIHDNYEGGYRGTGPDRGRDKAYRKRFFVVPDFTGSQRDAERHCRDLVRAYSYGVGTFELSCSPVDFSLNDTFGVVRTERVGSVIYRVLYGCIPDGSIALDIRKGTYAMRLSGVAVERSRTVLRRIRRAPRRSSGVRSGSRSARERGVLAGEPFSGGSPFLGKG